MPTPLPEGVDTTIRAVISQEIQTRRVLLEVLRLERRTTPAITRFLARIHRSGPERELHSVLSCPKVDPRSFDQVARDIAQR